MALKRATEAQFQAAVIELARYCGWRVYHTYDSRRSEPGYPDLTLTRKGRLIYAELKSNIGRLSPAQREWLADLSQIPSAEVVVWRPAHWDLVVAALMGGQRVETDTQWTPQQPQPRSQPLRLLQP